MTFSSHPRTTILSLAVLLAAASPVHADNASVDLADISLQAARDGASIWSGYTRVEATLQGAPRIVPPHPIAVGQFAHAAFQGPAFDWEAHDTLVLDVLCETSGELSLSLSEYDGEQREDFTVRIEGLQPGAQQLRIALDVAPAGDLQPTVIVRDGQWNPDAERGVRLLLMGYPRGFVIEGLRLESSKLPKEDK